MTYTVLMHPDAGEDIDSIEVYIALDSPSRALAWREMLLGRIESLDRMPRRCRRAVESRMLKRELRQMLFGEYRVLFTIRERTVVVLHVRHAARKPWSGKPQDR
jgi:plasmid stabilization system protein ParE